MIAIDTEKVMDGYTGNVWPFAKNIGALVIIGWVFELVTDIDTTAFRGAGIAFCMFMYIPYLLYKMAQADADNKKYDVDDANSMLASAIDKARQATEQRGEVIKIATVLKEKANALQEKANALASECERLRADERTRLEKLQTLNKDLQTLADERQALLDKLANAETLQANAIANAKANALKPHRPYINAGQNYLLYAVGRAISNHNSSYSAEDKQRAGEAVKGLKIALDEFRDEYKENAEKSILS